VKPALTWATVPVGYFTKPVRAWFGQDWRPVSRWGKDNIAQKEAAVRGRDKQLAAGVTGTIHGLSKSTGAAAELYKDVQAAMSKRSATASKVS